jgi:hypothetical protein
MVAHRLVAPMAGLAVVLASGVGAVATARPGPAGAPSSIAQSSIVLRTPLPNIVRIAQRVTITGRVATRPLGARVALEAQRTSAWSIVAGSDLPRSGAFSLLWQVQKSTGLGPLKLRVVVTRRGRLLVSTPVGQSFVGSALVYCKPAVPPASSVPAGDGWIVGGVYGVGGAFPGIFACLSTPYMVTATNASGAVVASQTVPALHSYTLVVPAGTYTLASGGCRGNATVVAGRQTKADTHCDYP